jgi:hypothetical protein
MMLSGDRAGIISCEEMMVWVCDNVTMRLKLKLDRAPRELEGHS